MHKFITSNLPPLLSLSPTKLSFFHAAKVATSASTDRPTEPPTQPTSAGDEATQPTFFLPSHAIVGFVILPRRRLWRLGWRRRRRRRSWLAAETSASALYSAAGREVGSSPTPMSKRRDSPKKPKDFLPICLSGSLDEGKLK